MKDNFNHRKWFKNQYLEEGMTDKERASRKEDLEEITFGAAGTDKRTGQVVGEILELIRDTGIDPHEVIEEIGQEFGVAFEFGRG